MFSKLSKIAVLWAGVALGPVVLAAASEARQLEQADRPDVTAQQKYQTAIAEAGGGLKINLADCRGQPAKAARACVKDAQSRYQQEMAVARELLRHPERSTSPVVTSEIRTTETVIPD